MSQEPKLYSKALQRIFEAAHANCVINFKDHRKRRLLNPRKVLQNCCVKQHESLTPDFNYNYWIQYTFKYNKIDFTYHVSFYNHVRHHHPYFYKRHYPKKLAFMLAQVVYKNTRR